MAINKPSVFIGENDQEQLYVTQANTGINTTNPTEKLEIAGNCKADFFIGDGSLLTNVGGGGGNLLPLDNTWTGLNTFTAGLLSTGAGANSFRAGTSAGNTTQGTNAVAVGTSAGNATQGNYAVAVGREAGETNQGGNSVAVGRQAGEGAQGTNAVAVGQSAGQTTQGTNSVAMGNGAGKTSQGANATAVGYLAGETTQGSATVALGYAAGNDTQGLSAVAIGNSAGQTTQGNNAVAIGNQAGQTAQGIASIAVGIRAGETAQGRNGVIINATGVALDDTSNGHIHITTDDGSLDFTTVAGWSMTEGTTERLKVDSTGLYVNGILIQNGSSFNGILATGDFKAITGNGVFYGAQGVTTNLAIGDNALAVNANANNVAIGSNALSANTAGINSVAIGGGALQINLGDRNVAVGAASMLFATGSDNTVIGDSAGGLLGTGSRNTVIGRLTGTQMDDTLLIGAGATERIKVDAAGLFINGLPSGGGTGVVNAYTNLASGIFTLTSSDHTISITGTAEIVLPNQSTLADGQTYTIINYSGITKTLTSVSPMYGASATIPIGGSMTIVKGAGAWFLGS